MTAMKHNCLLDFVKLISAWAVVAIHTGVAVYDENGVNVLYPWLRLAVPLSVSGIRVVTFFMTIIACAILSMIFFCR